MQQGLKQKNMKTIITAFFIALVCLNADCNKIETEPTAPIYQIEGRLVESCNDNSPLRNYSFTFPVSYTENSNSYDKTITTDSNGYFKFTYVYTSFQTKFSLSKYLPDSFKTKTLISNIPTGKNLNIGNIPYNFTNAIKVKIKNNKFFTETDSLYVYMFGNSSFYKSPYLKGMWNKEDLGTFELKEIPYFENSDSAFYFTIRLYQNKNTRPIIEKKYPVMPCGTIQEIMF
jgi:hypothetical protein